MRFTVIAAAAFLIASAAIAQEQHPPETSGMSGQNQPDAAAGNQAFADPSLLFSGTPGAFIGLAVNNIQGEGSYASTVINTEFSLGPVGVGLSLPLNLLLWNNDQSPKWDNLNCTATVARWWKRPPWQTSLLLRLP